MATKKKRVPIESASEPTDTAPTGTEIIPAALPAERVVRVLMEGDQMETAIREYKELQRSLDRSMPDQLIAIRGKPFRKKGYWRAVRTAFGLSVGELSEERIVTADDWGYRVTYRATAPLGNYADGDGTCMASEKEVGAMRATEHNVRAHAHTRGFNRAVSNLVGFGEVSAEEIEFEPRPQPQQQSKLESKEPPKKPEPKQPEGKGMVTITKAQKELYDAIKACVDKYKGKFLLKGDDILVQLTKGYPDLPQGTRSVHRLSDDLARGTLKKFREKEVEVEEQYQKFLAQKKVAEGKVKQ